MNECLKIENTNEKESHIINEKLNMNECLKIDYITENESNTMTENLNMNENLENEIMIDIELYMMGIEKKCMNDDSYIEDIAEMEHCFIKVQELNINENSFNDLQKMNGK
jgi:hypothetical protein